MSTHASPSHPAVAPVIDPEVIPAAHSPAVPATKPSSRGKPSSKAKGTPTSKKTTSSASKKPTSSNVKKPASSTAKKVSAPKGASTSKASAEGKLTFEAMIKDAIKNDKENVRAGLSRPAIKKYLAFRFKVLDTPGNIKMVNKALSRGAEKGVFVFPKGTAGRVKLAKLGAPHSQGSAVTGKKPSTKATKVAKSKPALGSSPTKKLSKSASTKKAAVKKTATKKPIVKKVSPVAPRKTATGPKKAAVKKTSSTSKRVKAGAKKP